MDAPIATSAPDTSASRRIGTLPHTRSLQHDASAARPRRAILRGATLVVMGSLASLLGGFAAPPAKTTPPPDVKPTEGTDGAKSGAGSGAGASTGLGTVFALLETSQGDIVLELDGDRAPISVENFLKYVDDGYYAGTIFHRVIDSFMIQGGGFNEKLESKSTRPPIKNEWTNGLRNDRGTIAMARLPQPDSATAQFFINVRDNPALNGNVDRNVAGYAVFGRVAAGMDVVDVIRAVPTEARGMHQNVPKEPVVITRATRLEKADAEKRIAAEKADEPAQKPAGDAGSGAGSGSGAGGGAESGGSGSRTPAR